jgi:hypothetical protein
MRRRSIFLALALLVAAPAAAQPKIKPIEGVGVVLPPQVHSTSLQGNITPPPPPATPVSATPIHAGETVQGRLEEGDAPHGRGRYVDTYLYDGREGETVVVTLRSADFDTYVAMGRPTPSGCRPMDGDDNGAGGTDSRLTFDVQQNGPLHIHVRSRGEGSGAYTLTVERQ